MRVLSGFIRSAVSELAVAAGYRVVDREPRWQVGKIWAQCNVGKFYSYICVGEKWAL